MELDSGGGLFSFRVLRSRHTHSEQVLPTNFARTWPTDLYGSARYFINLRLFIKIITSKLWRNRKEIALFAGGCSMTRSDAGQLMFLSNTDARSHTHSHTHTHTHTHSHTISQIDSMLKYYRIQAQIYNTVSDTGSTWQEWMHVPYPTHASYVPYQTQSSCTLLFPRNW
jgi:hypothetical protein